MLGLLLNSDFSESTNILVILEDAGLLPLRGKLAHSLGRQSDTVTSTAMLRAGLAFQSHSLVAIPPWPCRIFNDFGYKSPNCLRYPPTVKIDLT